MATDRLINQTQGDSIITALQAISGNQATSAQVAAIVTALQTMAQNVWTTITGDGGSIAVYQDGVTRIISALGGGKNLLTNWYFPEVINQKRASQYTTAGYTVDRWLLAGSSAVVAVSAQGVTVTNNGASGYAALRQRLEGLPPGDYVCSVLTQSGELLTSTLSGWDGSTTVDGAAFTVSGSEVGYPRLQLNGGCPAFTVFVGAGKTVPLAAVCLESGSVQTMAVQSGNIYRVASVPDRARTFLECMRFYQASTASLPASAADCRPPMRATPTQGTFEADGVTYNYNDANL